MTSDDRTNDHKLGARGPVRDETEQQQEDQRNDLGEQAAHQTDASASQQDGQDATGTLHRAEQADGRQPEPDHLGAAERAFEESRGIERRSGT